MSKLKENNPVIKGCAQSEGQFEYCKNGHGSNPKLFLSTGKCFLFYLQDTQIEIITNRKASLRVSDELSMCLRYLRQDQNLSVRSLSRRHPQFSLQTIWRHATKKIEVHPEETKEKGGRKPKLSLHDES